MTEAPQEPCLQSSLSGTSKQAEEDRGTSQNTPLSPEQISHLSEMGRTRFRAEFRNQGFHIPVDNPHMPNIQETVNKNAAEWKQELANSRPNLQETCLEKIESETRVNIALDFVSMYMSKPKPNLDFRADTHPARPAP